MARASARRGAQGQVPWMVLADPEGNRFCVVEEDATRTGPGMDFG
jgi:hypothetical protein